MRRKSKTLIARRSQGQTVSMRDIAREAGVSVAAVSYAINGREQLVSPATRARILETVRRMDYQPNLLMRAVRTRRTQVIGVLVPSFRTTFFPEIIDAVERALSERGYHVVMCQTHSDNQVAEALLTMLRQRRVDGLIATPKFDQTPLYRKIVDAGIKTVFVDHHLPDLSIPSVQSDDAEGAFRAVNHLIAQGRRRIATIRQPDRFLVGGMRARFEGYCRAMKEAGVPLDETLIGIADPGPTEEKGHDWALRLLTEHRDVTAVFTPSDYAALGVMRAARKLGRAIPGDLAMVGYCNQDAGRHTTPTLSTVDQKPADIGRVAVERLMAMIEGKKAPHPLHYFITPELIVRESSEKGPWT